MKHLLSALVAAFLLATPAQATCFAHYKAKQDDPLRLHYGVMALPTVECDRDPSAAVANRLSKQGWILLTLVETTTDTPTKQEKVNAGVYFLRF